jgi:16S rRNA (uracil1498-N3)-methyltransferase
MHRFYLPPDQCRGQTLLLTGSEAHHALHVLRLRQGEHVLVLDGEGAQSTCEVVRTRHTQVELKPLEQSSSPRLSYQLTLLQALPKGKLIESIIQKATELGAARVVPLLTQRTVIHLAADERRLKGVKWQAAAIEAIKQCGSPWLTKVEAPLDLKEFLLRGERFELALVGSLQEGSRHPRAHFESFGRTTGRKPRSACVWIGPEGDFTTEELDAIQRTGALPISLGPLVLRTETAAIYSLSIINYELQEHAEG